MLTRIGDDDMSEALLDKKFGYWQNQLLDLGKRNKMINYRETKRATLKLVEPEFEELFNRFDRDIDVNNYETSIAQMNSANQFFQNNPQAIARDFTNNWFWEWIARVYYKNIEEVCYKNSNDGMHEVIDRDCICINFNYTHTLEDMFGIKKLMFYTFITDFQIKEI